MYIYGVGLILLACTCTCFYDNRQTTTVLCPVFKVCHCKGKLCKKLCIKQDGAQWNVYQFAFFSRCIKKAQSLAEADPLLFLNNYLHTHHTLAYRDLLSGNKKRFCLATDTIKVLSSSGWMTARSPGHLQNTAHPQLIWHWRWMDGYV